MATINAELNSAGKKLETLEQKKKRLLQQEENLKRELAQLNREAREAQRKVETKGKILIGSMLIESAIADESVYRFLTAQMPHFLARAEKKRPADEKAVAHWLEHIAERRKEAAEAAQAAQPEQTPAEQQQAV